MDIDELQRRKQDIVERYGPWTAHSIHLGEGLYTYDKPFADSRLRRFLQIAADITDRPFAELRILDLACLEGLYGVEAALQGATVVANEGRRENLVKAAFVRDALGLDNLELRLDDVRNLSIEQYGRFDVVFCLGILYHLDSPDAMDFIHRVASVCSRVAIIDTHISLEGTEACSWQGHDYYGHFAQERFTQDTVDENFPPNWFSLDNPRAFVFTHPSLCNLLKHAGFTSVYESINPYEYHSLEWPEPATSGRFGVWKDRVTLVAIKGSRQGVLASPVTEEETEIDRPERPEHL